MAEDIGPPMQGRMGVGGGINVVFEADLARHVAHRPSVLYRVLQPGSGVGGIGIGPVHVMRPWNEWPIVWGHDIDGPAPALTDAEGIARNLIGDPDVPFHIKSASPPTPSRVAAMRAMRGHTGRRPRAGQSVEGAGHRRAVPLNLRRWPDTSPVM